MDNNPTPQNTPNAQPDQNTPPAAPQEPQVTLDDLYANQNPASQNTPAPQPTPDAPNLDDLDDASRKFYESVNQNTNKTVQEATKNVAQNVNKVVERQTELMAFFNSEKGKHFQPYLQQITKAATDPRFIDYKLDRIIPFTLGQEVMVQIGAKMNSEADNAAAAASTGGNGQNNPTEKQPIDYFAMSQEEFKNIQDQVRMGTYKAK